MTKSLKLIMNNLMVIIEFFFPIIYSRARVRRRQTNFFILHKSEKSSDGPGLDGMIARSDILPSEKV